MTRYVGPSGPEDTALLPRRRIIDLIDARIESALADYEGGGAGGAVNPVYVRRNATGNADGSDFDNAYGIYNIGSAIANAAPGATVHILCTDTYTSMGNINIPAYATTHLSEGNEVTIQASDANGDLVLPIDPATDYTTVAEALAFADDAVAYASAAAADTAVAGLWDAVYAPDTFNYTGTALILNGTRTPDPRTTAEQYKAPITVGSWSDGAPMFSLNGVSHLIFKGIGFKDVGNGCFLINGTCENIHFEDCAARNVYRYVEMAGPNLSSSIQPYQLTNGSDTRSDVRGMEKGPFRIKNGSNNITITDPHWDLRFQHGSAFATGLEAFAGSAYNETGTAAGGYGPRDITVQGVDRIAVIANAFDGRTDTFRNGDGLTFERVCTNVTVSNVLLAGHTDAALDNKMYAPDVSGSSLDNVIGLSSKINLKFWRECAEGDEWDGTLYSIRPLHRGGTSGSANTEVIDPRIRMADLRIMDDTNGGIARADSSGDSLIVTSGTITQSNTNIGGHITLGGGVTVNTVANRPRLPTPVYKLSAFAIDDTQVVLSWSNHDGHWDSLNLTFDVDVDGNVTSGYTTTESASTVTVTGLSSATEYDFRVRAVNTASEPGTWSLTETASTLTAASSFTDGNPFIEADRANYSQLGVGEGNLPRLDGTRLRGASGNNGSRYISPLYGLTADHEIEALFHQYDYNSRVGVACRFRSTSNRVLFRYNEDNGVWELYDSTGIKRSRATGTPVVGEPLKLKLRVSGTTATCWVDDVLFDWSTDGSGDTTTTVANDTWTRVGVYGNDGDWYLTSITAAAV